MRIAFVLTFLLSALIGSAQWVGPIEQSYGPYQKPLGGPYFTLAAAKTRVLLAWSEVTTRSEIRTGLLDFDARLVTPIVTLPTLNADGFAMSPAVASDGDGFYVVWVESAFGTRSAIVGIALDANGHPIGMPRRLLDAEPFTTIPVVGWSGEAYFVGPSELPTTVTRDGTPLFTPLIVPHGYRYIADGFMVGVTTSTHRDETRCNIAHPPGCAFFPAQFELNWWLRRNVDGWGDGHSRPYYADAIVAGGAGLETAIVWRAESGAGHELHGIRVINAGYHSSFAIQSNRQEPPVPSAIAFDGERWLLVLAAADAVFGAFIERGTAPYDLSDVFHTFAIAESPRNDSGYIAVALAPGRFLIAYNSDLPGDQRIVGRIVLVSGPPKRRSVR